MSIAAPQLVPAAELVPHFRAVGGGRKTAIALTVEQVDALEHLLQDDPAWTRLCDVVARTGDPWNADDWPDGFDPLLLCAALCDHVAFECARCHVGCRQGGSSCAEPRSVFGHVLTLLRRRDRDALRTHLQSIRAVLSGTATWDLATTTAIRDTATTPR